MKQQAAQGLIEPHEVVGIRADEQIVFAAGNIPLRCGRAIWFQRDDIKACVWTSRLHSEAGNLGGVLSTDSSGDYAACSHIPRHTGSSLVIILR
ncbi:hypothetical protein NXC12_PD00158 (plasmid) [Rhizobium etli]|uniref:Uncharacterized protein n=1 Tax=Rhizobium etli TaxID=29449 RepID=A0AAN1BMT1_RHIET|nr:hypothetical protein NXC12_PD00158 [Rhizobium etli]